MIIFGIEDEYAVYDTFIFDVGLDHVIRVNPGPHGDSTWYEKRAFARSDRISRVYFVDAKDLDSDILHAAISESFSAKSFYSRLNYLTINDYGDLILKR